MSEMRKYAMAATVIGGALLSGCTEDQPVHFSRCSYNSGSESTGENPVYLQENAVRVNYQLVLGENSFRRNTDTGLLEWRVGGVKQEMFPEEEIVVFDKTTERTAVVTFIRGKAHVRADIATECNSEKPLTPINNH